MISDRPSEVNDRTVPDWEVDLITGASHMRALGALVERTTRFVLPLHLADVDTDGTVENAIGRTIATLPHELMRRVTSDKGIETSSHRSITLVTSTSPSAYVTRTQPWQRGSNEGISGLLRQ